MLSISSNAFEVAALLEAGVQALPNASAKVNQAVGGAVLLATTRAMEELIYEQPLPPSYGAYGLSDRTGALLAGEALIQNGAHESVITTENSGVAGKDPTIYAEARHANTKYPAPWREVGLNEVAPELPGIAETALLEAMPQGLVTK